MRASKGFRRGTRRRLKNKGHRLTVNERLKELEKGKKVCIVINPSVHDAMPHPRYQGKFGEVVDKRGKAYLVNIKDGGKTKTIISYPEHLKEI